MFSAFSNLWRRVFTLCCLCPPCRWITSVPSLGPVCLTNILPPETLLSIPFASYSPPGLRCSRCLFAPFSVPSPSLSLLSLPSFVIMPEIDSLPTRFLPRFFAVSAPLQFFRCHVCSCRDSPLPLLPAVGYQYYPSGLIHFFFQSVTGLPLDTPGVFPFFVTNAWALSFRPPSCAVVPLLVNVCCRLRCSCFFLDYLTPGFCTLFLLVYYF